MSSCLCFRGITVAQLSISRPGTGTVKAVTQFPWCTPPYYWTCARKVPKTWPSTLRTLITPGRTMTSSSSLSHAEFQVPKSLKRIPVTHTQHDAAISMLHRGVVFSGTQATFSFCQIGQHFFLLFILILNVLFTSVYSILLYYFLIRKNNKYFFGLCFI